MGLSDFAKISLSRKKNPTPKLLNIFGNMCEFYFCSETFQLNKLKLYCKMKCFLNSYFRGLVSSLFRTSGTTLVFSNLLIDNSC